MRSKSRVSDGQFASAGNRPQLILFQGQERYCAASKFQEEGAHARGVLSRRNGTKAFWGCFSKDVQLGIFPGERYVKHS